MVKALKQQSERIILWLTISTGGLWGIIAIGINLLSQDPGKLGQAFQKSVFWPIIVFPLELSSAFLYLPISLTQPLYTPGSYLDAWHVIAVNSLTFITGIIIGWAIGKLYIKIRNSLSDS